MKKEEKEEEPWKEYIRVPQLTALPPACTCPKSIHMK
jgi:hypothetical protein